MIRPSVLTKTLLAAVVAASGFAAFAQEKVTVQLKWLPQGKRLAVASCCHSIILGCSCPLSF